MPRFTEGDVFVISDNNRDVTDRVRLVPTSVSEVLEWTPELVIIVVCLAFAGAFNWPLLALGALLAALRIVGERAYRTWSNARVRRQYAADRAAARAAVEARLARMTDEAGDVSEASEAPKALGGETR